MRGLALPLNSSRIPKFLFVNVTLHYISHEKIISNPTLTIELDQLTSFGNERNNHGMCAFMSKIYFFWDKKAQLPPITFLTRKQASEIDSSLV